MELLKIGMEADAVDRTIEHTRRRHLVDPQRSNECCGFPMTHGTLDKRAAARAAAVAARYVGRSPDLVDEETLGFSPVWPPRSLARRGDISPRCDGFNLQAIRNTSLS